MTNKPHRIRVRALDGKPRNQDELNRLKSNQLKMPHLDILLTDAPGEFIICAAADKHIQQVRDRLSSAGLEEIVGGDTDIPVAAKPMHQRQGKAQDNRDRQRQSKQQRPGNKQRQPEEPPPDISKKPYGFVPLPQTFSAAKPIWHDGTSSAGRLSGEVRFELETLTPLLVGWERGQVGDAESEWPVPETLNNVGRLAQGKSVLCPLRAPWDKRPVIIPGDTLKGLLRHELGALLGAPMERVAERSYSYRPNAMFPKDPNPFLVPRLARVPENSVQELLLVPDDPNSPKVRVPSRLELFTDDLEYNKKAKKFDFQFDQPYGANYRGGQGAGAPLNSKHTIHSSIKLLKKVTTRIVPVPQTARNSYLATLRHLVDLAHGHFSERHPDVPNVVTGDDARNRILKAAQDEVFQPGDMIWVEWDTERECISFGWHYYYRWAYLDTVRRDADAPNGERRGLFPLPDERAQDSDGAPKALSPVRRLFGYTGDNEGSKGIGKGDYEQLMGRVSINAALEVVGEDEADNQRFLPPTFLKELGMPRPSAVEFYLQQPYHPNPRPSDRATLVTYGDAAGYDEPGELAGRKFYLDRSDAYTGEPWKDDSAANRANERSTLALEASKPGRKFRFTLRFRDLDPAELAAVLVALCPHQFREVLGGAHPDGYCSKLGYARPLGWGSVRIEAKALLFLELANDGPQLRAEQDIVKWVRQHYQTTEMQAAWLDIHCHKHPDAADYPKAKDNKGNENIYTFHTDLRARHSRLRRYKKEE